MPDNVLRFVDLVDAEGKPVTGLVSVRNPESANLSIDERAAIFDAAALGHIDFVFFRRFSDGRSSQISAYVVNNSDERLDNETLAKLHQKVWLQGTAPLLYVAWPSRIDVLTCARGPDFWSSKDEQCQYKPATVLLVAGEINRALQKFSALRLADGTFWEDPENQKLANHEKAAHRSLIQAVLEADKDLKGDKNPILRRLLLLMVLIKYLEDRRVFPNNGWFGRFHKGAKNFWEILQGGEPEEVYRLLSLLENKFNGDIFLLPAEGKQKLSKKNLERFADFVGAKMLNRQLYLWEQFSFEHLPVEIISHLYQHFVQGGHGAVYTPPFLAALLLDYAMPYEKLTGKERILDPACGSGVFLVGAFRRLINFWRSQNGWQRPNVNVLKSILKRSIWGIELDGNAVDLTAFSLSLALCDALQPEVIWRDLRFDRLRESNLLEGDFFQLLLASQKSAGAIFDAPFDRVIGNPPFKSKLSPAGAEIDQNAAGERGTLPDRQTAFLFLEQALNVLRPEEGRACLIQPSGLLYNRNTQSFRTALFKKYRIDAVLDFTSIRQLYEAADPKTIAVVADAARPTEEHWINHSTFRRTVSVHERICFELDHYDRHRAAQKQAENEPYVWRANLLGGGRLLDMSQRLRSMRTLAEFVKQKGWDYGEGFVAAKTGKRAPAPFLTGSSFLPTAAFTDKGIDEAGIETVKETHFRSAYTEDRYSSPLVLIKEADHLPLAFWDKGFLAYRDKIIGIHAPSAQADELRALYERLRRNHKACRFACTLNGTQSLIGKATAILKQDVDVLPYPEDAKCLSFSFWEEALRDDVLKFITEYVRLGQNSELLKTAADDNTLHEYADIFLRMLGSVYDNLKAGDPIFLNGLICQPFYFGERPNLAWLEEQNEDELQKLIYEEKKHAALRTIRVLRFYAENVVLLVKPERLRYWIRSVAIRDADETLVDLYRQGY